MEDYDLEEDIKEKYNLIIYQNQKGTFNLSQDNKYKFYISNNIHKGKIKYRYIKYKNSTLENKEKCLSYFVIENDKYTNDYNSNHTEHGIEKNFTFLNFHIIFALISQNMKLLLYIFHRYFT